MSLYSALKPNGPSGFGYGSTAEEVTSGVELAGKTVVLTGCNSGLGKETMRVLSSRGASIVGLARTTDKAEDAGREVGTQVTAVACDLSEPRSAARAAQKVADLGEPIDVIIANAGIMALPELTVKHGLELQFLTNHLGHFILVTRLLDALSASARVVVVSSSAHRGAPRRGIVWNNLDGARGYGPWRFYGQSKLANILFARHLATRLRPGQVANALHPGVIHTNLTRHMNPITEIGMALAKPVFLKTIPQGAATQCYLAAHPDGGQISGEYLADCNVARTSARGRDVELAADLWTRSEELAGELLA